MNNIELKQIRKSLGFSETEAAKLIGRMSQSSWHKLERGIVGCTIHSDIEDTLNYARDVLHTMLHRAGLQIELGEGPVECMFFTNDKVKKKFLEENSDNVDFTRIDMNILFIIYDQFINIITSIVKDVKYVIINNEKDLENYYAIKE